MLEWSRDSVFVDFHNLSLNVQTGEVSIGGEVAGTVELGGVDLFLYAVDYPADDKCLIVFDYAVVEVAKRDDFYHIIPYFSTTPALTVS